MSVIAEVPSCAEKLARFFPALPALRIPVRVQSMQNGQARLREATLVEYGAAQYAIFVSTLPLEFDERVKITREGQAQAAEATVIALQYHEGRKAVAVRFLEGTCTWMTQP